MPKKDMHKQIQEDLIDIHLYEKEFGEMHKEHLATCQQCHDFWQNLKMMQGILINQQNHEQRNNETDDEIEIDERVIRRAFKRADKIKSERKNFKDYLLFLSFAVILLGIFVVLGLKGYLMQLMILQIFFIIAAPFSIPIILKIRSVREAR